MQLKWLKINIKTDYKQNLPFFTGSMLRGVIGHALKRVVCINPSYRCQGCFASQECTFFEFYEKKDTFHPYRLGITLQPKVLDFSFYLFEHATSSLPYILTAVKKALEEEGVGRDRNKVKIKEMYVSNTLVHDGDNFLSLQSIVPEVLEYDTYCPNVTLEFTMPIRIKENNALVRNTLSLHTLIGSIQKRYDQMLGREMKRLNYKVEGEIIEQDLIFVEMKRYSNRHKKSMKIGGVKGKMVIHGLDKKSYEYLKIGEILGAGKQTVFGLGSYIIKEDR